MEIKPKKLSTAISLVLGTAILATGSAFAGYEAVENGGAETSSLSPWVDVAGDPNAEYCNGGCGPVSDAFAGSYVFWTGATNDENRIDQDLDIPEDIDSNAVCMTDVHEYVPPSGLYYDFALWFVADTVSDEAEFILTFDPAGADEEIDSYSTNTSTTDWYASPTMYEPWSPSWAGETIQVSLRGYGANGTSEAYWDDVSVMVQCTYDWVKVSGREGSGPNDTPKGSGGGNGDPKWTFSGAFWTEATDTKETVAGSLYYQDRSTGRQFVALPGSTSEIEYGYDDSDVTPCDNSIWDAVVDDVDIYDADDVIDGVPQGSPVGTDAFVCLDFGTKGGGDGKNKDRGTLHVETDEGTGESGDTGGDLEVDKGMAEGAPPMPPPA